MGAFLWYGDVFFYAFIFFKRVRGISLLYYMPQFKLNHALRVQVCWTMYLCPTWFYNIFKITYFQFGRFYDILIPI